MESERRDVRGAAERRARRAWREGSGPWLRAAGALYGAAIHAWSFAYEAGLLWPRQPALPTISVGGVTVGGSGKTPVAAEVARMVTAAGHRPAVVTRGFPDELALHARMSLGWPVIGHPDRRLAITEAARSADVAVLDDGFQHRRLGRDLDLVLLDADVVGRVPWRLLPSGPFREPPSALGRADAIVVTRRSAGAAAGRALAAWARRHTDVPLIARCALEPGALRRVAVAAKGREPEAGAGLRVAVTGIMKPEAFLAAVRARGLDPALEVILPDHGMLPRELASEIVEAARGAGVVTTGKDLARLAPALPAGLPLWCLEERLTWEEGVDELRQRIEAVCAGRRAAPNRRRGTG